MRRNPSVLFSLGLVCALCVAAFIFVLPGCEGSPDQAISPVSSSPAAQGVSLSKSDSRIIAAMRVQEKHTNRLMAMADVVGTAVGLDEAGEIVVKIYTTREGVAGVPATLDGMKAEVEVTGIIRAMAKPSRPT